MKLMLILMMLALLVIVLPGCASTSDPDAIAGYTCHLPSEVRAAQAAVASGTASDRARQIAAQPCTPYTVAEERERQERLDSCHLLSGCEPRDE